MTEPPTEKDFDELMYDLVENIEYSDRYSDDNHIYRHVTFPEKTVRKLNEWLREEQRFSLWLRRSFPHFLSSWQKWQQRQELLSEEEVIALHVRQSPGWTHHMLWTREPHIMCFRRVKTE